MRSIWYQGQFRAWVSSLRGCYLHNIVVLHPILLSYAVRIGKQYKQFNTNLSQ
jgi:hypothetical protein